MTFLRNTILHMSLYHEFNRLIKSNE
jgi:hypothetical protein